MPERRVRGVGLGLRWEFLDEVLLGAPVAVDFFEVSPENYMRRGGYYPHALERIADRYPVVTHGLTLSLGSNDDPEPAFVSELRAELDRLSAPWHSDHLSFTSAAGRVLHELLPIPFDEASIVRVADRMRRLEDALGRPMAIENITYYAELGPKTMPEPEFIARVLERSGGSLLLDVNNVYVNSRNFGFDPLPVLAALPLDRVVEIHVAGHTRQAAGPLLDTHGTPVCREVLELLAWTLSRTGPVPVLLERDNDVPELGVLLDELETVRAVYERSCGDGTTGARASA